MDHIADGDMPAVGMAAHEVVKALSRLGGE
jgi:hypothetical protein